MAVPAWSRKATPPRGLRLVQAAQALLLTVTAVFLGSTLWPRSGFDPLLDGWLQATGYALAALVALLRPVLSPVNRRP